MKRVLLLSVVLCTIGCGNSELPAASGGPRATAAAGAAAPSAREALHDRLWRTLDDHRPRVNKSDGYHTLGVLGQRLEAIEDDVELLGTFLDKGYQDDPSTCKLNDLCKVKEEHWDDFGCCKSGGDDDHDLDDDDLVFWLILDDYSSDLIRSIGVRPINTPGKLIIHVEAVSFARELYRPPSSFRSVFRRVFPGWAESGDSAVKFNNEDYWKAHPPETALQRMKRLLKDELKQGNGVVVRGALVMDVGEPNDGSYEGGRLEIHPVYSICTAENCKNDYKKRHNYP